MRNLSNLLRASVLLLLRPLLRIVLRIHVEGSERVAPLRQFVLVANHNSHLDALLVYLALPVSRLATLRPVAALDYFRQRPWLYAAAQFLFRPVWIDREAAGDNAITRLAAALDAGDSLLLFPEGSRGRPGKLARFKNGIGRLLQRRPGIAVVPAYLNGTERSLPRGEWCPSFVRHCVIVGVARTLEGAPGAITHSLRTAVEALGHSLVPETLPRAPVEQGTLHIAVIGIDGCGKSTVSRRLARELSRGARTCLVSDTVEFYESGHCVFRPLPWLEAVRRWTGALAKRARSLVAYKLPKLMELLLRDRVIRQIERTNEVDVIVMDGCPLLNLLAWGILFHPRDFDGQACRRALTAMTSCSCPVPADTPLLERFPELAVLMRLRLNRLLMPHTVVLLDLDPDLAVQRIEARGEIRQGHENASKLNALRGAYLTVHRLLQAQPEVMARRLDAGHTLDIVIDNTLQSTAIPGSQCHV